MNVFQVWTGPESEIHERCMQSVRYFCPPGWNYVRLGEKERDELYGEYAITTSSFGEGSSETFRSEGLRYCQLHKWGGIYVDQDFVQYRSYEEEFGPHTLNKRLNGQLHHQEAGDPQISAFLTRLRKGLAFDHVTEVYDSTFDGKTFGTSGSRYFLPGNYMIEATPIPQWEVEPPLIHHFIHTWQISLQPNGQEHNRKICQEHLDWLGF